MKILRTVVASIVTICVLVSMTLCFGACGNEGKDNSQVETTVVATTVAPTTIASTTVAPTTVKTTQPTTETIKAEAVESEETEDTEDAEDGRHSYISNIDIDAVDARNDNDDNGSEVNYSAQYSPDEFQNAGVISWDGHEWTYYSELILPGDGLNIPGRHTTSDGYVCDGDGYVVLAADLSMLPRYSVVDTPFGYTGKVYDTGCAYGILDVYVGW